MILCSRARDHVGQRFAVHRHPSSAGVDDGSLVGHDADVAGEEDEVAARRRCRIDILVGAEGGELQVAVAR